jgi:hypothetical protein
MDCIPAEEEYYAMFLDLFNNYVYNLEYYI